MSAASGEREQLLSDVRDAPTVAADLLRYWGIHTEISVAAGLLENFAHHITRLETENAALRAALDFSQWSESQVDAARGLLIYYLGGTQDKWSLRDHMRAGGYEIPLKDGENYNGLPKNLVAHLILRIALNHGEKK